MREKGEREIVCLCVLGVTRKIGGFSAQRLEKLEKKSTNASSRKKAVFAQPALKTAKVRIQLH